MRHFVLLLLLGLALYGAWQLTSPLKRPVAKRALARHGLRLLGFVMILFCLLLVAYFVPAFHLL